MVLITAASTWGRMRGMVAASTSWNFRPLGLVAISRTVCSGLAGSRRVIRPAPCSSSSARPVLDASFGRMICAPFGIAASVVCFLE
ncbi:hypothetical protein D3C72_2042330 [compost metagenome]